MRGSFAVQKLWPLHFLRCTRTVEKHHASPDQMRPLDAPAAEEHLHERERRGAPAVECYAAAADGTAAAAVVRAVRSLVGRSPWSP